MALLRPPSCSSGLPPMRRHPAHGRRRPRVSSRRAFPSSCPGRRKFTSMGLAAASTSCTVAPPALPTTTWFTVRYEGTRARPAAHGQPFTVFRAQIADMGINPPEFAAQDAGHIHGGVGLQHGLQLFTGMPERTLGKIKNAERFPRLPANGMLPDRLQTGIYGKTGHANSFRINSLSRHDVPRP